MIDKKYKYKKVITFLKRLGLKVEMNPDGLGTNPIFKVRIKHKPKTNISDYFDELTTSLNELFPLQPEDDPDYFYWEWTELEHHGKLGSMDRHSVTITIEHHDRRKYYVPLTLMKKRRKPNNGTNS